MVAANPTARESVGCDVEWTAATDATSGRNEIKSIVAGTPNAAEIDAVKALTAPVLESVG